MPLNNDFIYTPPQEPLEIIYEDEDLVVVNKPAGLLSVMGRLPEHQDSAYLRILEKFPTAKVTHRLDMATSGLLIFAKHRDAEVAVSKMFQARTVKKYYVALVQGQIQAEGSVEVPLITDWENRPRQMVHFELGKQAKTLFQLMEYDTETDQSRVRLEPVTGRSHQLRVHMMHIGHPIMGDKLYHPDPASFYLKRMALHAAYLAFQHPLKMHDIELYLDVEF
ncbi:MULTISPECIES: pseudouridine synthase [unclassified Acinetobacter]|uniref:pseudouridine synthase n=1 Tax=unclassified Acinetobacter TaxID=196816 RepID=UPI0024471C3A|nr:MULTISPECIES: pseudouridine synthase [unclassified Acinetobacter]MDH0031909.1 pseudouridine synthase [Acinetobacter sp. GD04021]MDH0887578.1 pseudouridine synthase [Acinetobacter sp. GD03873]MDH1083914.1 pseudouridine synthase [Acinetobacter sp. GD03983]MDH2190968.1 pseudouridine synthase [Acinetobacter sp. GD03645]MDH2204367.1 pseudouridine synthase [Acinetobacter sp. GD03647]